MSKIRSLLLLPILSILIVACSAGPAEFRAEMPTIPDPEPYGIWSGHLTYYTEEGAEERQWTLVADFDRVWWYLCNGTARRDACYRVDDSIDGWTMVDPEGQYVFTVKLVGVNGDTAEALDVRIERGEHWIEGRIPYVSRHPDFVD